MNDIISKLLMIILIVVMIVVIPSLIVQERNDMIRGQMVLYETKFFIDKVTERKEVQPRDIDEIQAAVNMYGSTFEVDVELHRRDTVEPKPDEVKPMFYIDYIHKDKPTPLEIRDGVKVRVREVHPKNNIYEAVTGYIKPPLEFSLMGTVK